MSNARNIASGAKFVDTAGDTMTGNLGIGGSPSVNLDVRSSGNTFALVKNTSSGSGLYIKADTDGDSEIQTAGGNNNIIFRASGVERMQIDSSGRVTTPNQPAFQAYGASGNSGTTNNDWVFPNTRINIGNHYSTSTGRFTAPVAGTYLFGWTNIGNTTNDTYRYYIRKNGSAIGDTHLRMDTTENGVAYGTNGMFTWPITAAASDYFYIYFTSSGNTASYVGGDYPQFWGYLIG
tara:strand:- start:37 stop:741 length:705 start_codon:yes stop_codon:yes gene_type:complete